MDNCILSLTDRAGNENNIIIIIEKEIAEAPDNSHLNWDYTINNEDKTITLNHYSGNESNVTVYKNYEIDGIVYKTKLNNNSSNYSTNYIFSNCNKIKTITFNDGINTSNLTNIDNMFYNCILLENINISNIDTSNVTSMQSLFAMCVSLKDLDISNFNTSNVEDIRKMFECCESMRSVNLNGIDTKKVKYFDEMFRECNSLETLDLTSFDTNMAKSMTSMFSNCTKLLSIKVNKNTWVAKNVSTMFNGCGTSQVTYV